jgi:hypothetical protein
MRTGNGCLYAGYLEEEDSMSRLLQRRTAILIAIATTLVFATAGVAQIPGSPWKKGAPFPEPDEELYGVAVNGKLYVIGGWGEGKARGANYEYDPATDKWTKKKSMPRPAHHAALAVANGKIYVCGGFVPRRKPPFPSAPPGNRLTTSGSMIPRPIPGKPWRRCPPKPEPRWPWKSAARFTSSAA